MEPRSDSSLASLLLTNRLVSLDVEAFRSREYWVLLERIADPGQLLGAGAKELAQLPGQTPDTAKRIARLLDAATALAFELERLSQQGIQALTPFDEPYPQRLRGRLTDSAPPVLFCAGALALMAVDGIGVVGSRNIDDAGAEVATGLAKQIAGSATTLVSGAAKGVDQLAMGAALRSGGTIVGVPADGLGRNLRDPDLRRAIGEGRACMATPYKPAAGFSVANAMGRNKVVYGLCRCTVVVAADEGRGGSWE
ncbi:MAG: DNA-processing protein DprA, partial [Egibacteraceae bacterium]